MAIKNKDFEQPFDATKLLDKASEILDAVKEEFLRFRALDALTIQFGIATNNRVLFRIMHGDRSPNVDLSHTSESSSKAFHIDSRLNDHFVVVSKGDVGLTGIPKDVVEHRKCEILKEIVAAIGRDQIQAIADVPKTFQLSLTH